VVVVVDRSRVVVGEVEVVVVGNYCHGNHDHVVVVVEVEVDNNLVVVVVEVVGNSLVVVGVDCSFLAIFPLVLVGALLTLQALIFVFDCRLLVLVLVVFVVVVVVD
jgi:hypothetical protein